MIKNNDVNRVSLTINQNKFTNNNADIGSAIRILDNKDFYTSEKEYMGTNN